MIKLPNTLGTMWRQTFAETINIDDTIYSLYWRIFGVISVHHLTKSTNLSDNYYVLLFHWQIISQIVISYAVFSIFWHRLRSRIIHIISLANTHTHRSYSIFKMESHQSWACFQISKFNTYKIVFDESTTCSHSKHSKYSVGCNSLVSILNFRTKIGHLMWKFHAGK